jgi:pyruvate dehydrogenase E2 component (dihydrolipoamide acetyltransferase)
MARIPIAMPILGYDMESGRIGQWLKAVGDTVSRGDVLAEIETDKATVEMESVAAGRLVEIVHDAGADVRVGDVIGYLDSDAVSG